MTNQAEIQTAINYMKIQVENNKNKLIDNSIKNAYKTAIEALEKQVPIKPREHHNFNDICNDTDYADECWLCKCNNFVDESDNYCPNCGQKLDWS
jgi:rubrerythrin